MTNETTMKSDTSFLSVSEQAISKQAGSKLDGSKLAIINARFEGVARKMSNTLLRTGRSGVLNRARDFSCCIVTHDCELLTAAESLPIHTLSGPDIMARCMKENHPNLKRGDAFLHNSPYHGCSHPADHSLLVPVFDDNDVHRYTVVAKAHQADIGNSSPTTYNGAATDVYNEGALIFPAVKIQSGYEFVGDIVRMCQMRIRVPQQWYGDLLAMVGAARIGEQEIETLATEFGWDTLSEFSAQWFDYSEKIARLAIGNLPKGRVEVSSAHDALPGIVDHEIPIHVVLTVDPVGTKVTLDLRDNMDCVPCGLNVSEACARTSAMIGLFNSIDHSIPKNAGSFRCIDVLIRSGSVAGGALHPFSCSVATTNVSDRIANSVQCGMAELSEGAGMAEIGAALPASHGVISGIDPRNDEAYINQIFLGSAAGGASYQSDGWLHYAHAGNGGMAYVDSIELTELYHPIRIYKRGFVMDAGGAGRQRGAPSKYIEYGPIDCEMNVAYVADGAKNNAKGVRGGLRGGAINQQKEIDGQREILPACGVLTIKADERFVICTNGGGGYGDPSERSSEDVEQDYLEGWISAVQAKTIYGWVGDLPERNPLALCSYAIENNEDK